VKRFGAFMMGVLTTVLLTVAALSISFSLLLTPPPTHLFSLMFADGSVSGLSQDEMAHVADGILSYSLGDDAADIPTGTDYHTTLTPDDLSHLRDCRGLFLGVIKLAAVSGVLALIIFTVLVLSHRKRLLGRSLVGSVVLTAALVAVAVFFAVQDFSVFFNFLHSFFFTSGSWLFPPDCLMISALPTPFWMAMGVLWALLLVLLCVIYATGGRRFLRATRR